MLVHCLGHCLTLLAATRRSYESADLWPLLASPADGVTVSFVKAERSTFRWGGTDEARIRQLGHAVHLLPNSGHWVSRVHAGFAPHVGTAAWLQRGSFWHFSD